MSINFYNPCPRTLAQGFHNILTVINSWFLFFKFISYIGIQVHNKIIRLIYNSTSPSSSQKVLWDIKFIILVDALIVLKAFKCINTIWPFLAMPYCQNPSSGDIKVTYLVEGFLFIFLNSVSLIDMWEERSFFLK